MHRKFEDHPFWKERRVFSKAEAWIDIIWQARWQEETQKVLIGNTMVECGYGQSLKSLTTWANRWGWSESTVRRFMKLLEDEDMIVRETVAKTTRITVCNYRKYQKPWRDDDAMVTGSRRDDDDRRIKVINGIKEKTSSSKVSKTFDPASDPFRLACLLRDLINLRSDNGNKLIPEAKDMNQWAKHIDLMIRKDGRLPAHIERVIRWCQQDSFWCSNIMSTQKLREQWPKLADKMNSEKKQRQKVDDYGPQYKEVKLD